MCQSSFTIQIATPSFSREQKTDFAAKEELRKEQDGLHHSCMNHKNDHQITRGKSRFPYTQTTIEVAVNTKVIIHYAITTW